MATMERQEIREKIWQYLQGILTNSSQGGPQLHNRQVQLNDFQRHFKTIKPNESWEFDSLNWQIVREEIHGLYTANVLFPGYGGGSGSGSVFTISMFGAECINAGDILPFDPDGYIKALRRRVPTIDAVAVAYVHESVACFSRQFLLSSTITLGAASEKSIIVLIETFADAISNASQKAAFKQKIHKAGLYVKYKLFKDELEKRKGAIPADLLRDFDVKVDSIFNFIRLNRNAAGHPTGTNVDRAGLQANLQMFASYAENIYALIGHLKNNPV
jgi:hypothetical protein